MVPQGQRIVSPVRMGSRVWSRAKSTKDEREVGYPKYPDSQAMFNKLLKELQKELTVAHRKSFAATWKRDAEKTKARLAYEKIQLIRNRKSTTEVELQLKQLESGEIDYPPLSSTKASELIDSNHDVKNLQNVVTYLKNQRVYNELLERYNPGLTMTQLDNIRRTANMVGLKVPEN